MPMRSSNWLNQCIKKLIDYVLIISCYQKWEIWMDLLIGTCWLHSFYNQDWRAADCWNTKGGGNMAKRWASKRLNRGKTFFYRGHYGTMEAEAPRPGLWKFTNHIKSLAWMLCEHHNLNNFFLKVLLMLLKEQ